jgi:hypothetical protein
VAIGVEMVDLEAAAQVDIDDLKVITARDRSLRDYLYFVNYMCGFTAVNREEHGDYIDTCEEILATVRDRRKRALAGKVVPEDRLAIKLVDQAARGTFKTSTFGIAFSLRLICEDRRIAIRFNLNKVENAVLKTEAIGQKLRFGRIPQHFGPFYQVGTWSKDQFKVIGNDHPEDPTVIAGGPDERQASTHCDVIINSDVQDDTNSQTDALRRNVEGWRSNVQSLYRQNSVYRIEVWDTTRWHQMDIAGQLKAMALRKPKPKLVWLVCKPVADLTEWKRRPETCKVNFPRLFPREKIAELFDPEKSGLRENDVYLQYFLDTSHSTHTKFKEEWLAYPPMYDPNLQNSICTLPRRLNLYVTIDPADPDAIQKARDKGDLGLVRDKCDTGMVLSGMDERKHRYIFAAVSAQMNIPDMGEQIIRWFRAYHMPDKNRVGPGGQPRSWQLRRVGVEKALFSGLLIEPLCRWLSDQPAVGPDWAKRLCNQMSAIQISTQRSKAARQDATEVDYATGRVRIAQQQRDLDPQVNHPVQVLIGAKQEYPNITRWDVLDAESLMWGVGFMAAPYEQMSEADADRLRFDKERDDYWAIRRMKPDAVMNQYAALATAKGQDARQYGASEMGWN